MWQKLKNSLKKWEDKKTSKQLYRILIIEIVLWIILLITAILLLKNNPNLMIVIIVIMFIILDVIAFYTALLGDIKAKQEKYEEKKNREKAQLQKFFNGKSKIEVRLISNRSPYYTEKDYEDLRNLVFLHMLTFVQKEEQIKFYAELSEHGELNLSMILDEKDKLNGTKPFDEFPCELLLKYFEPVEE